MDRTKPIIQSLLDTDFYKFTMGQFVFRLYPKVQVTYSFKNRTPDVPLAKLIPEEILRSELDAVRRLSFTNSELHYLRGTNEYGARMFSEDYLEFLRDFRLPPYTLKKIGDTYNLEFHGFWHEVIYWEIHALAIINELYYRAKMELLSRFQKEQVYATGTLRLAEKINLLKNISGLTFCDFGTRRRFSFNWQDYVVKALAAEISGTQFRGTSNVFLAMKHGLMPMGTSAHELFMVAAGMGETDELIHNSHSKILNEWWDMYDWGLSVALTDTFGTDFFFRDMTKEHAKNWKGLRQDSGDPIEFGEKAIEFYKRHGIDPESKIIVFSDGLDTDSIVNIYQRFKGRIRTTFGWGTNLTNDLGFAPLSLVVKTTKANGCGLVKLSDNLAKAIGSIEDIERYKKIFNHTSTLFSSCKY